MNATLPRDRRAKLLRAMPALAAVLAVCVPAAHAATFVVTSAVDPGTGGCTSGECTLREAITAANATATADAIHFSFRAIAGKEILIQPTSPLPTITQPVTIDGYSAVNTSVNTLPEGSNAVLRIRVDGASVNSTTASALSVCASNTTIRGLSITGFDDVNQRALRFGQDAAGQICASDPTGGVLAGNFIGLRVDGTTAIGNRTVVVTDAVARIGGPDLADRNVIAASASDGITFTQSVAGSSVLNNLIGTDKSGTLDRGHAGGGVFLGNLAAGVSIGTAAAPNRIAFNRYGIGTAATTGLGNSWFANRFQSNDELGIDLESDGTTANDGNDTDTGPNNRQNFPLFLTGVRTDTGVTVTGTLDVGNASTQNYRLALYASDACDASGNGEGERLLSNQLRGLNTGNESFTLAALSEPLPAGTVLTMTATAPDGSTSEFSPCFALDPPPLVVNSTADPGNGTCDANECTLREAIAVVNARAVDSLSVIEFDIPGAGPHLISYGPVEVLRPLTIDGFSQPGADPNDAATGSNAVLRIELDGLLRICSRDVTVTGLALFRLASSGFPLQVTASCATPIDNLRLLGNHFGLRADGSAAPVRNGRVTLVGVGGANVQIGSADPADRNLFGNMSCGLDVDDQPFPGLRIQGNSFGLAPDGTTPRPISDCGIFLGVVSNPTQTGGMAAGEANRIANITSSTAAAGGIRIGGPTGAGHAVFGNEFLAIDGIPIDLGILDGVTPNDTDDADTGPNGRQNFPSLTLAQRSDAGLRVNGSLDVPVGTSSAPYTLAFYASATCNAAGHGPGERFLGAAVVNLTQTSGESFLVDLATDDSLGLGTQITATATAPDGSTSEFSGCLAATDPPTGFLVNSTSDTDDGSCNPSHCSLREAINAANAQAGADQISFDIIGIGPFTIALSSNLPRIVDSVLIDGYSQAGAFPNTLASGTNAILQIQLEGASRALELCADNSTIQGLAMGNVALTVSDFLDAAGCSTRPSGVRVMGNFFGSGADGNGGKNVTFALFVAQSVAEIGSANPADRNLFATASRAITLFGSDVAGGRILGNMFGSDLTGTLDRGHADAAIVFDATAGAMSIGDVQAPNRFGFSTVGILVGAASNAGTLFANDFASHDTVAINLCPAGTNLSNCADATDPNDDDDSDSGANNLQNFPLLSGGSATEGSFTVTGELDVPAATSNAPYTIALYESTACDALGNGEGELFLGTGTVNLSGNAQTFSVTLNVPVPAPGRVITATATDPAGNTSEFSGCFAAPVVLTVFADGFES